MLFIALGYLFVYKLVMFMDIVLHVYKFSWSLVLHQLVIGTFSLYCLRPFVVVYKRVMLLLMDCVCIPTFIVVTLLVTYTNSPLL